jgi:hypothetical protein
VRKFIFRYLDLPLTNGLRNILVDIAEKDILNKFIELNKFLNNVCIIRVNDFNPKIIKNYYNKLENKY